MRKRTFEIIELAAPGDHLSTVYDTAMMVMILLSMVPLFFKTTTPAFTLLERTAAAVFIVDYLLRLWTADLRNPELGGWAFVLYPFGLLPIIDLLSILPVFVPVNASLKLLRILRLGRAVKALKLLRYSKSFALILDIINQESSALLAVCWLAGGYVMLSALIMFNAEPNSFSTFFDAFYWAMVTLTTVGYGDVYPVTTVGRIISMLSSFMGIAIVALPTGIITSAYTAALAKGGEKYENGNPQAKPEEQGKGEDNGKDKAKREADN